MINYTEQITPNFNLQEFWDSNTANVNKVDNKPTILILSRLKEVAKILQGVRNIIEKPITVTSGYRCARLNKLVGGTPTSAHISGYAVDLQVKGMKPEELRDVIHTYLMNNNLGFDELIVEKKGKTKWLHFAYKSITGAQRKKILDI